MTGVKGRENDGDWMKAGEGIGQRTYTHNTDTDNSVGLLEGRGAVEMGGSGQGGGELGDL